MGARRREEGRGLKKEEAWAMADKDKKKLKVILKLPPKSASSVQPKSSPATAAAGAPGGGGAAAVGGLVAAAPANASSASAAAAGGGFTFSAPAITTTATTTFSHHSPHRFGAVGLQDHQKQHRSSTGGGGSSKNLQSGRHGVSPGATTAAGPAASSSGPALFHTAASFSSVRSSNSLAGGPSSSSSAAPATAKAGGGGSASSLHLSSPPGSSTRAPTPPKKRKFKTVEHAGALGVGAVVVGRAGVSGASIAGEGPGSGRDAGGGSGGSTRVGSGGGGGAATGGVGGRGGNGGERDGGGREGSVGGAAGGRTGLPPASSAPFPVKKSHKKQVKPFIQTDGPQAHNPFAGVILPEKAPSESLSKSMLEGVLEKLQKKDTYAVFAEPVDATQVPDYYDIIKEPMDFGTMRKKIKKGSYTTVEGFEGDIYLICSNAMRYNGPETIYYKQARAIRDMARKALEGIRAQLAGEIRKPVSHKKKQSPSKKSHAKKPALSKVRVDGTGSDFASGATLAGDGEPPRGWSNSTVDAGKAKKGMSMESLVGLGEDSQDAWVAQPVGKEARTETQEEPIGVALKPMGPKDGRRPLSTDEYHRNTYKQRLLPAHGQGPPLAAIGGESRQLVSVGNQVEHAYAKSLAKFGAGLGPRAWCFIAKRLELLNAPTVQPGTTNGSLVADKTTVPLSSQTGASTESYPPAGAQSGGVGGDRVSSPSGRSHSDQVDPTPNRPSGVPHTGQVVDSTPSRPSGVPNAGQVVDSTPSAHSVSSNVGQGVVSTPGNPTVASRFSEAVASMPNHTTGATNVGEAVVSSQNYASGASQVGQAVVPTSNFQPGGASYVAKAAVSTLNHPSGTTQVSVSIPNFPYGPSHVGQAVGSSLSSSGPSHLGQAAGSSLSSSGPSHVAQAVGSSFSSSGASQVGQTAASFPVGGTIGITDQILGIGQQVSSQQGGGSSDTQHKRGNGRLDNVRSDSFGHTSGTKQILGLDSNVASEENKSVGRLGWTPVTGVDQTVSGLALGATGKAFSQAWSTTPLKHGSTSYAYAPMASSGGRDEASAQAWAQARVMSLSNPADAMRNLSREAQVLAFLSQKRELPSDFAANVPPILQSNVYTDYNNRPRQSAGLLSSVPNPQTEDQRPEAFVNKSGGAEQKGSVSLHSQGNMRPAPLQQSSLQQRAMPPDLNVALLSPSALQSPPPPPQQGSTPTSSQHPDLKLQL